VTSIWQTVRWVALLFAPHALERDSLLLRFTPLRWLRDRRHVLNPFWVETTDLLSPLRASACYDNLNDALPQLWAWQSGRDIGGWVDQHAFTIFLLFPYRSSFRPLLTGRVSRSSAATRIRTSLAIDRRLAYFVAVWFAALIPSGILLLAQTALNSAVLTFGAMWLLLVVIAFLVPIVALGHSTHEPDRTKLLTFLEQTIAAAPVSSISTK
jgi:hypothetical protein